MHYFGLFSKYFQKSSVKCSRVLTKNTIVWETFEKTFKNFFEKSTKMPYFGPFSKEIQNPALNFRAFRRKT